MWFLLTGCISGLTAVPSPEETTRIFSISPDEGDPAGGEFVTIEGRGFSGDIEIFFGNLEITNFTNVDDKTLVVTTPEIGIEATVDVEVSTDFGRIVKEDGFSFRFSDGDTDDGGGPFDDTDDGGSFTGGDGVAGLVQFVRMQTACVDCFLGLEELMVTAEAAFHDPVQGSWIDWMPSTGSCVNNPQVGSLANSYTNMGQSLLLEAGTRSFSLFKTQGDSGPLYVANGLNVDDYVGNSFYDLRLLDQGTDLSDAVLTPGGFDAIAPYEMLYVSPYSAFTAQISKSGQAFTWAPSGTGQFLIGIGVYSADGTQYLGEVLCRSYDNGSFVVPSSTLSPYPAGALLEITLTRMEHVLTDLPSGGTLESIGQSGVRGTGILVY